MIQKAIFKKIIILVPPKFYCKTYVFESYSEHTCMLKFCFLNFANIQTDNLHTKCL